MDSKLLLLLLVIAVVTDTANGKYEDSLITEIVKDRIMQNKYFHCYPLIQPGFKQYAVLMILPEPPQKTWHLLPSVEMGNVLPSYKHASAPSHPVNYLVARRWWPDSDTVEEAEQVLMKHIQGLYETWKSQFFFKETSTILLYTKMSPCQDCANAIKEYRQKLFPEQQFIVAYSDSLNGKDADNILQDLKSEGHITVVQVPEIPDMREKCVDVLKEANVCYKHLSFHIGLKST